MYRNSFDPAQDLVDRCQYWLAPIQVGQSESTAWVKNLSAPTIVKNDDLVRLLMEDESQVLDFKRDEYRILDRQKGCNKKTQAAFLKDMLAFANTTRRAPAIILLGATKEAGKPAQVLGIETCLDNAYVEQFLNGKLNRPITFSYFHLEVDRKKIAIIEIPEGQKRPFHLTRDFDDLKRQYVYVRRNSSTDTATPDEIAQMGVAESGRANQPLISVDLWDPKKKDVVGNTFATQLQILELPQGVNVPDYIDEDDESTAASHITFPAFDPMRGRVNGSYFRELVKYRVERSRAIPISFAFKNNSGVVANDVRIELGLVGRSWSNELIRARSLPQLPQKRLFPDYLPKIAPLKSPVGHMTPRIDIHKDIGEDGYEWSLEFALGKMQPGQSLLFEERIFFTTRSVGDLRFEFAGNIFADEIRSPVPLKFNVAVSSTKEELSVSELAQTPKPFQFRKPS